MRPNEVKPYSESYQHLWKIRESYQEFRFTIMNMMVDDAYDKTDLESKAKTECEIVGYIPAHCPIRVIHKQSCEYCPKKQLLIPLEEAQKHETEVKGVIIDQADAEIKKLTNKIVEAKKILNELTKEVLDKWCWTDDCPTNCNDCRFNVNFKRLREALK